MKITTFETEEEWFSARDGKITGSTLKNIIAKRGGRKIGFYELIAQRLAIAPDGENPMERGSRLESESIARFEKETGKKVDTSLVIWSREDNPNIAISPDGFIGKTEAVETKSLSSARHIEAWLTKEIPTEYKEQVAQYFVVNDDLEVLFVCFYDPRIPQKDFFYLSVQREDIDVAGYLENEISVLAEVTKIVNEISKF